MRTFATVITFGSLFTLINARCTHRLKNLVFISFFTGQPLSTLLVDFLGSYPCIVKELA